jgi:hypothetical protein
MSAESEQLIIAVLCFSAGGFIVLQRQRMKDGLLDGVPPGTVASCCPAGDCNQAFL